jgi:hypothetical protein
VKGRESEVEWRWKKMWVGKEGEAGGMRCGRWAGAVDANQGRGVVPGGAGLLNGGIKTAD